MVSMECDPLELLVGRYMRLTISVLVCRDQVFPPSQNRKKGLDGNSLGRRPDFMLRTALRGFVCYLFFMEAKKARQGTSIVQDDLEKLAGMMKDSIDDMSKQGIDVSKLEVIGLHIVGKFSISFDSQPLDTVHQNCNTHHHPISRDGRATLRHEVGGQRYLRAPIDRTYLYSKIPL